MTPSEDDLFEMNRLGWDRRTPVHIESDFYDVPGFLQGACSLREIELAEMPEVAGKTLLHLQCHFGLDTMSWARRGAICTGVDFSPVAIEQARQLAMEAGVSASFLCRDLYSLEVSSAGGFDIVFTSYGTIGWLPDLDRWAQVVARHLAVDGQFYMADFHPVHDLLAGDAYFEQSMPVIDEVGSYTDNGPAAMARLATWSHPLSSVLNALLAAGIRIERVNEFPFSPYNCFAGLVEREPGRFSLEHKGHRVPLVYSISGRHVA